MYTETWNDEVIRNTAFLDRNSIFSAVEVGCFEGLTSNFIIDHLLAYNGTLFCIDPLEDNYELESAKELFNGQFDRFMDNTSRNKDRVTLIRKKSEQVLQYFRDDSIEFIYIDGHHSYNAVLFDTNEAFRICKVGGYILIDDINWGNTQPIKKAVELFLLTHHNHRLLLNYNQVLIQKLEPDALTEDGQERYQELSIEKTFSEDKIYMAYTNLDSRPDRNEKMIEEIKRVGLPIVRQRSFPWKELYDKYTDEEKEKVGIMFRRTAGAIGCHYSQVAIMQEALRQGKHAWVNEDDIVYCSDLPKRLKIIFKFLNQHEWDIFWFGAMFHIEPTWHKSIEGKHTHPEMQICKCLLNRDWEETNNPHIVRAYGAFSTHSFLVNKDRIQHILDLLERNVHLSMGIDWIMLKEQPNLNCYAFVPGCAKQFDSMSDISNGFAKQSGFANLGKHWFADSMDNFKR